MGIFEEVSFEWNGRKYSIPPDRILQCIAKVEDVITLVELHRFTEKTTVPYAKLAMAYGMILRHAGAQVEDAEVHEAMFKGGDATSTAVAAVNALLVMMIPPSIHRQKEAPGEVGKTEATSAKP